MITTFQGLRTASCAQGKFVVREEHHLLCSKLAGLYKSGFLIIATLALPCQVPNLGKFLAVH